MRKEKRMTMALIELSVDALTGQIPQVVKSRQKVCSQTPSVVVIVCYLL